MEIILRANVFDDDVDEDFGVRISEDAIENLDTNMLIDEAVFLIKEEIKQYIE